MKTIINILLSVLILASCATTSTTMSSTYTKPEASESASTSVQKIVVYALTDNANDRRLMEDAYVAQLGSGAVPSYNYISQPISRINQTTAEEKMKSDGYQGAMLIRLVGQQRSGGSRSSVSVQPNLYYGFGGGWSGGLGVNITPGTVQRSQFSVQASLYDLSSSDLLWSGTAVAANPDNIESMARDVASATVQKMRSDGIR